MTAPRFELTSQRQKVSRLPTEPPGRYIIESEKGPLGSKKPRDFCKNLIVTNQILVCIFYELKFRRERGSVFKILLNAVWF